jgi:hypothetical protein
VRIAIGISLLAGSVAAAPDAGKNAQRLKARALFAEGQKALDAGDVQAAKDAFGRAYDTLPNAAVLLKIAECKHRLSDEHGAVEALERYLSERPDAPDRAAVDGQIADLKKTPGIVAVESTPRGASILVDGTDTSLVTPSEVRVPPGEHVVSARLPRYVTAQQKVLVDYASHAELTLTLDVQTAASSGSGAADGAAYPDDSKRAGHRLTAGFWVAAGGTVAAASVMTAFGVIALDEHARYQKKPTRALYDDGRRDALIADVALGVTAASAITAAVLFFTSKPDEKAGDHAFVIAPSIERRGGGVVADVHF